MLLRKILAIKLRALGDTVLMTAALAELRRAFPSASIHVLVDSRWAPLLENQQGIDRLWTYDRRPSRTARARALAGFGLKLRRERFDCVVNFHASPSSAILAFATSAKVRAIHFHGHRDRNRFTTVEIPGKGTLKPIIERDMDAIRSLGVHVPAGRQPVLALHEKELEQATAHLARLGLAGPILGIGLGASRPTKRWPIERFALLAVQWCRAEKGGAWVAVSPDETPLAQEFMKAVDDALQNLEPRPEARAAIRTRIATQIGLPVRELGALLARSTAFAGNDSGPRHLAAAVGTPTVTLFGPEHPFEWHPYPVEKHPYFFIEDMVCRRDALPGMPAWCALETCVVEEHRCMRGIGVSEVLAECRRVAVGRPK